MPSSIPATPPSDEKLCLSWEEWNGTRHLHAGSNDPRLRASEPADPDVDGAKYFVLGGGPPTGCLSLIAALERMIDRDEPEDRLVVAGSHRPIVVWSKNNRGRYVLKPHFVGSSVEEVRAVRDSGLLHESGADHVMLRVRMRRSTLERIRVAAEHVRIRTCDAEGRKGKFMSTWVLSILLDALAALETEISAVNAAGFSGKAPRDIA